MSNDIATSPGQPLSLHGARKSDVRIQFAALCYRMRRGKIQVLIITSRRTKSWILPKGWPIDGRTPSATAALEAWEEAGVRGSVSDTPVGTYSYAKIRKGEPDLTCLAMLYPLKVKSMHDKYPERKERRRQWVSRKKAARLIQLSDLARLILHFEPNVQKRKS